MEQSEVPFADRFTGCLLGLTIGDALGVRYAYRGQPDDTLKPGELSYKPRLAPDRSVEAPAGQFSVNTELALCVLETLVTSDGFVDPELAIYRFENVMQQQDLYLDDPREHQAIVEAAHNETFQSGGNAPSVMYAGPAVRVVPVGMVHSLSDLNLALVTREVMRSVLLTDGEPQVVNGALAIAHATRLILRQDAPLEILVSEVLSMIDEDDVARALRRGMPVDPPEDVAGVVATALHAVVDTAGDLETGLVAVVERGGATHLTGAIVGALSGAYGGASAIRQDLIDGLEGRAYALMAAPALLRTAQMRAGVLFQLRVQ